MTIMQSGPRDRSERVKSYLLSLPRSIKQLLMLCADVAGISACVLLASWVVFEEFDPTMILPVAATLVTALALASFLGFYHSIIRYVGMHLAIAGLKVALISGLVLGATAYAGGFTELPFRLSFVYLSFCLLYLLGARYTARYLLNRRNTGRERVIIYGAGEAGARLVLTLQDGDAFSPIALVDDKRALQGKRVGGLKVHSRTRLEELIEQFGVSRILLALPSASRRRRKAIISSLEVLPIHVQTVPDLHDLVSGKSRVDDLRDVEVEDLLGRDTVPPNDRLLSASVSGKNVMVTGAGGSIGSELCRQVMRLSPKCLILYEISEVALYNIERELRSLRNKLDINCRVVALLGNVHHEDRIREVMATFEIDSVYHAAAYKHVPVVEHNILEGVHNNVFGTLHAARAAVQAGVDRFVLISTDKAVSPTNVMGATKRMSELVLQAMQDKYPDCCFCMVRFGNVLESSGSVVPLFREQIRAGGPVTVTHRDIIRYFMTIPEAAQLVIQASAMAEGGDVFVLDMGDPVKIQDLARRMIHLMGLSVRDENNPEGDIEIVYTGLRPAEKLYEELLIGTNASGTEHPRIMRASEAYVPEEELSGYLDALREASARLDRVSVRDILQTAVVEYNPSNQIDDHVHIELQRPASETDDDKVISITQRSA